MSAGSHILNGDDAHDDEQARPILWVDGAPSLRGLRLTTAFVVSAALLGGIGVACVGSARAASPVPGAAVGLLRSAPGEALRGYANYGAGDGGYGAYASGGVYAAKSGNSVGAAAYADAPGAPGAVSPSEGGYAAGAGAYDDSAPGAAGPGDDAVQQIANSIHGFKGGGFGVDPANANGVFPGFGGFDTTPTTPPAPIMPPKDCGTPKKGDQCYNSVVWAMTKGINTKPEWYPHLTTKSKFTEFQQHLSTVESAGCPPPCPDEPGCLTALPGTDCYGNANWIMTTGLKQHPGWFPELREGMPVEAAQNHINHDNRTLCPTRACSPLPFKLVTLFCWAVVRSQGYELPLVKAQFAAKAGMFACDDYAVVSDVELGLEGVKTLHVHTTAVYGVSVSGTSPNAPLFVEAWHQIQYDGRYRHFDWIAKVDPDTVLIPFKLREQLSPGNQPHNPYRPPYAPQPTAGQWAPNCDKMRQWGKGWGGLWPMMFGSIELFSRQALDNYWANEANCQRTFGNWMHMGEDRFMGLCLRMLHADEVFLKQGDGNCGSSNCGDGQFGAYHPRKDINSWMGCWHQATR